MAIYRLDSEYDREKFIEKVRKLLEEDAIVELKKKHPQRTLAQNAYLHVALSYWASEYGCQLDEAKVRFFKELVNPQIFWKETENRKGIKIRCLRSTADLTTAEMTLAIERFRRWSERNEELPIYIPAPNEYEALIYAQQVIDRNAEFV